MTEIDLAALIFCLLLHQGKSRDEVKKTRLRLTQSTTLNKYMKISVLGISDKQNIDDVRESTSIDEIHLLTHSNTTVSLMNHT